MNLKNKLFIITLIALCILLFFNISTVNATVDVTYKNENLQLPDFPSEVSDYAYKIVVERGKAEKYVLCCRKIPFIHQEECSYFGSYNADCINVTDGSCVFYSIIPGTTTIWEKDTYFTGNFHGFSGFNINWYGMIYSNADILNKDDGAVFFQETPQVVTTTTTTTITKIAKVEELPKIIAEILKVIIPVGLVIFGMVLLILVIKSVISRMK